MIMRGFNINFCQTSKPLATSAEMSLESFIVKDSSYRSESSFPYLIQSVKEDYMKKAEDVKLMGSV